MDKMFKNGHAEKAPPVREGEECWYLPIFGVCHPGNPGETRVVFDSSAQFKGVSLNSVLLTGPDLINSLHGVLLGLRKEPVVITVDIKHMFYCFLVRDDHRNYLRFLCFRNNIYSDVVEYRMKVHVFRNSPSPAVVTYGLRRTAREGEEEFGSDVRQFIERDFYVDDGLKSLYNDNDAISLIRRTQQRLAASNLKLHKIASNCPTVLEAFPEEGRAKDLKDLDLSNGSQPILRSLGVSWNMKKDVFTFTTPIQEKPFTRCGVFSVVNSLQCTTHLGLLLQSSFKSRRKWQGQTRSLKAGDLVLLRDSQVHRNEWPMGLIVNVIASADGKARKVEIKTGTRGVIKTFLPPVTETVLLIPCKD
ncbi:uncharacterized protein LOC142568565 [Dermacentor variabilis]|uniref:uncharacterized protein LOC142568565 n=1 Tax=Dermacentor variabilis TaxID=34621 RepID=UPI003F5B6ECB